MRPLQEWPIERRHSIRYLFSDLDETLTYRGRLPASVYRCLEELEQAGIRTIIVTGRSAGWGDLIARLWPVTAVVAESGGMAMWRDGEEQKRLYWEPTSRRQELLELAQKARKKFAFARFAKDVPYREVDIAFDHAEHPPHWDKAQLQAVEEFFMDHGAKTSISSIHLHAWFGEFDKFSMSRLLLKAIAQEELSGNKKSIFIGDSLNDASMFTGMDESVAVAGIEKYWDQLPSKPHYVTQQEGGKGFLELATLLLNQT